MATVLVNTPGASVSARDGQLVVETDGGTSRAPLGHVTELLLQGNARVSTAALRELLRQGGAVHLLDGHFQVEGSLLPPHVNRVELLERQFTLAPERQLTLARDLVRAKVRNSAWALRRLNVVGSLSVAGVEEASSLDVLRGAEGAAARAYFRALAGTLDASWGFAGRTYRPTRDPLNALLSYLYTLLLARTIHAVTVSGLHPCRGVLHVSHGARPALALDLMEPLRAPVCDVLAVFLLRSGRLARDGFRAEGARVLLGKDGCRVAAAAFADRAERWDLDAALGQAVRAFARALGGEALDVWRPPARA